MRALATGLIVVMASAAPATAWQTHKSTSLYTSDIGGLGKVTFRADSNPAFAVQMIASNDRTSLMIPSGQAIRSIKQFIGANSLFAQTLTVSEPAIEVTFNLAGLETALAPVRETCGW
ncbi:hypothetical protein JP75_07860 [Devosia riboflavina]|uniref:Uncharacterized protein n=1 Tax=Devosia riboflavina TaxID=46914 RepID=A0A087M3K5_9HYPH|nr:type VI secretion system-associated protein TagO [Devosia riboflavina]KFL31458.1 hypothetical protein JP75_07860 [Devosia riboflavina]